MSIRYIRKEYPWITYASYRKMWDEGRERLRWLLDRLDRGRPTSATCHEWNRLRGEFGGKVDAFQKAWRALPGAAGYDREPDIGGEARWPEDYGPLELCEKAYAEADRVSREVAAVLLDTERLAEKSARTKRKAKLRSAGRRADAGTGVP